MLFSWHHLLNGPRNCGPPSDLMLDGQPRMLNHVSSTFIIDCVVVELSLLYRGNPDHLSIHIKCFLPAKLNRSRPRVPLGHHMRSRVGLLLSGLLVASDGGFGIRYNCRRLSLCRSTCFARNIVVVPTLLFFSWLAWPASSLSIIGFVAFFAKIILLASIIKSPSQMLMSLFMFFNCSARRDTFVFCSMSFMHCV